MFNLNSIKELLLDNYHVYATTIPIDNINIDINKKRIFFENIYYYYDKSGFYLYLFNDYENNALLLENTPEVKLILSDLLLLLSYNLLLNEKKILKG